MTGESLKQRLDWTKGRCIWRHENTPPSLERRLPVHSALSPVSAIARSGPSGSFAVLKPTHAMHHLILLTLLAATLTASASAQDRPDRDTRVAWWREARFGMFVHWGLYSGLAGTWDGKPVPSDRNLEYTQRLVHADTCAAHAIPKPVPRPRVPCPLIRSKP